MLFQRCFVNVETTSINIRRLNFHFQPNINVETTFGNRRWIDVILSTLFQRCLLNVETSKNVRRLNCHFQQNINVETTSMNVDDQRCFNVDVFAGYRGTFLKEELSSVMLRKRDEVSFKSHSWAFTTQQTIIYSKSNSRNTRKRCEICSKLTMKTPERHHWRRSCVFIGNFENIS